MLSPAEQAHTTLFHSLSSLQTIFCHQSSTSSDYSCFFLSDYHRHFRFLHTCAPIVVTTTHLGLPSPPIIDWHTSHSLPGLVPSPHHTTITSGDSQPFHLGSTPKAICPTHSICHLHWLSPTPPVFVNCC